MSFSFKYKSVILKSGAVIRRPIIPFTAIEKERLALFGMLDSGSDNTIIPMEIASTLGIEFTGDNEIFGIVRSPVKAKEGKLSINFGKGNEIYEFQIPILVPLLEENVPIIIGREGFFNYFKITFNEAEKKIEFKKL